MSKPIFMSDAEVEQFITELRRQLNGMKFFGSISFKKDIKSTGKKASVYFTETAWVKIKALVDSFKTEVQWHGLTRRVSENEFEVYDIIVPPHEVSSATVTSDYAEYTDWLNALPDEVFNDLHFHGHSHVDMAVSPSGVDNKYRTDLVTQIPIPKDDEDAYYIFMIFNKKNEWSGEIFDIKNNTIYDTADITIDAYCGEIGWVSEFIKDAKKVAVEPKPAVPAVGSKGFNNDSSYVWDSKAGVYVKKGETKKGGKKEKKQSVDDYDYYSGYRYGGYYGSYGGWDE